MSIRTKIITPIALSLAFMLSFAIFVASPVDSTNKVENNMDLTYTTSGLKNGPYTMTIEAQQVEEAVAINVPIAQSTLTINQLINLIDSSKSAGNPLLFSDNQGVTAHEITYRTGRVNGKDICFFSLYRTTITPQGYYEYAWDMDQVVPISWATPQYLFHAGLSAIKYDTSSTLSLSFLSAFDLSGATVSPNSYSLTGNTLSVTGFDFNSHAKNSANPQALTITISNVKLANKAPYSTRDENINTIDERVSQVSNATGASASFPQSTVPVGPEYTYTVNYDANGGTNAPASQSEGPTIEESKTITLTDLEPTFDNYTFLGWDEDSLAVTPTFPKGSINTVSLAKTNATKTLYAIWQENEVTISYQAGKGGNVSRNAETLPILSGIPQGSTATADPGYYFVNWTDNNGTVVSTTADFRPTQNSTTTYIANFAPIQQTITPATAINTLKPTAPSTGISPKATDGVSVSIVSFILGLTVFGLALSVIARIKR